MILTLEEKVLASQKDVRLANEIISEYKNYISSCVRKNTNRFITEHDDEMSIAMLAFNEALQKYDINKGPFLNFAKIIIKNRMIDYTRKESKNAATLFSDLSKTDEDGNVCEFEIEAPNTANHDIKYELEMLLSRLNEYDISYFDLAKSSPKSTKTKLSCKKVIEYILSNPILLSEIKQKKYLPIKVMVEACLVNRKIIERHRNYIIAVIIILSENYDLIAEYFPDMKGGHR